MPSPLPTVPAARRGFRIGMLSVWLAAMPVTVAFGAPPMLPAGETTEIAAGVHVIPDRETALVPNVGIVIGDDEVLVIDTGMGPANANIVLDEVRRLTDLPIRFLVTTHFHPEHNYGAQALPKETILIYAIAQQRELERKGEEYRTWFIEMFGEDVRGLLQPVEFREPDVTFERRAELNLGGLKVELLHFGRPAHTVGDTIVWLPERKTAFVGDLVPNGRFPIMADADSSINGWIETLDEIAKLNPETIVPSHGPLGTARLIGELREYLVAIRERSRDLQSRGVPLQAAQDELFAEFTKRYPDWLESDWIRNAVERAYAESTAVQRD